MAYEAFEAAVADRDLITEELRILNNHRLESNSAKESLDNQAKATIKGLQATIATLENECEQLQAQSALERSRLMLQVKAVETQLQKATDENERLNAELLGAREKAVDSQKHRELQAAFEIEQFATQEAIAHAEAAEADNDRLSEKIESLTTQLEAAKAKAREAPTDTPLREQLEQCMQAAGPLRLGIAERIYSILEDFVEVEEGDKSPVVEHLESCCHSLSSLAHNPSDPLEWVTSDLEWLSGTVAAFRELLAAATSMVQQQQAAAAPVSEVAAPVAALAPIPEAPVESEHISLEDHEMKLKEQEQSVNKMRESLRLARADLKESRSQLRAAKGEIEDASKKLSSTQAENTKLSKDLKQMEGKLAQSLQQKREAYNKSRKVDQERERHQAELAALVQEAEMNRKAMEQRLDITAQEQQEYQAVTCDLRTKLEKELRALQKEHTQAQEDNAALMEDRVNLIAQLTETKILAQETLQKAVDEKDELIQKLEADLGGQLAAAQSELLKAQEDAEAHREVTEKYRVDLESMMRTMSDQSTKTGQLEEALAQSTEALQHTQAELTTVKEQAAFSKAEFDRDINELSATVNHMEEAAASRESAMAKSAQDALQKSIASARADALEELQKKEAALGELQAHLQGETQLEQKLKHTLELKEAAEKELTSQINTNMQYEMELQRQKQQVLEARQALREVEKRATQAALAPAQAPAAVLGGHDVNAEAPPAAPKPAAKPDRPQRASSHMSWLKRARGQGSQNKENSEAPLVSKQQAVPRGDSSEERCQAKLERKAALARLKERRV